MFSGERASDRLYRYLTDSEKRFSTRCLTTLASPLRGYQTICVLLGEYQLYLCEYPTNEKVYLGGPVQPCAHGNKTGGREWSETMGKELGGLLVVEKGVVEAG